jgi:hypothetical protein
MANTPQPDFDARVRAELRSIPVPPDLRAKILAGKPAKILKPSFWPQTLAIAASIALLATALLLWNRPPNEDRTFAGFQNRMAAFAVRQYSMDILSSDFSRIRAHLAAQGAPAELHLPDPLRAAPLKGGAKLTWQGHPVAMVCFDGPDDKTLYLFVVEASAASATDAPQIEELKGLATAAWTRESHTYLLAAELPPEALRRFL